MIRTDNENIQIFKIDRLKRREKPTPGNPGTNEWLDSPSLKITFQGPMLPQSIKIAHTFYRVRPYVSEPTQCYNCQRMGHTSFSCTSKTRCLLCAGNHRKDQCNNTNLKCANCEGTHTANSAECSFIKSAREIELVKAKSGESYAQARKEVMDKHLNIGNKRYYPKLPYNQFHQTQQTLTGSQMQQIQQSQQYRPDLHIQPAHHYQPASRLHPKQKLCSDRLCHQDCCPHQDHRLHQESSPHEESSPHPQPQQHIVVADIHHANNSQVSTNISHNASYRDVIQNSREKKIQKLEQEPIKNN